MLFKESVLRTLGEEDLSNLLVSSPSAREMAGRQLLRRCQNISSELRRKEHLLVILKLVPSLAEEAARQMLTLTNLSSADLLTINILVPKLRSQVGDYQAQINLRKEILKTFF